MALTDVFNYINYGRMEVVHHLNPYTTIPILEPHSDPSFALSNWHQLLSPYGPLFTLLTFAVVPLGVAALLLGAEGDPRARQPRARSRSSGAARSCSGATRSRPIVLVGLNPIVLVWGLGGDHNDFLMVCSSCSASTCCCSRGQRGAERGRRGAARRRAGGAHPPSRCSPGTLQALAGAAFVTAIALKASAAVLCRSWLASLLRSPRELARVLAGMLAAGAVLGAASLLAFGLHIPDLNTQSRLVTSESIPNLIGLAVGAGGETETLHAVMSVRARPVADRLLLAGLQRDATRSRPRAGRASRCS